MDNRTLIERFTLSDEDRAELFDEENKTTTYNTCLDMVEKASEGMEAFKEKPLLTKITLIARWAYLYGYGTGLLHVQTFQKLLREEMEEKGELEAGA